MKCSWEAKFVPRELIDNWLVSGMPGFTCRSLLTQTYTPCSNLDTLWLISASLSNRIRYEAMNSRTQKHQSVDAIIFDIGRVIVRLDPLRASAHLAHSSLQTRSPTRRRSSTASQARDADDSRAGRELYLAIQRDPNWNDWQEGRLTPREWHRNICRRFRVKITFNEFRAAWNSIILPEPDLLLPIHMFRILRARCRLVLLSNTDPLHVEHMQASFKFVRQFDAAVYSCAVGASKPSQAVFRAAARAARTNPARILFVDDVRDYVRAARRFGMQAIQFQNRPKLERELRLRGLL